MPRRPWVLTFSCAAVLVLGGLAACGGHPEEVLARVGRIEVTRNDFQHWMSVRATMRSMAAGALDPADRATPSHWTLAFLIDAARTVEEASEKGVEVSDAEARAVLDRFHYEQIYGPPTPAEEPELASLLSSRVETRPDQLQIVRVHLLAARLRRRELADARQQIAHSQVASYYTTNRARFVVPERRDVAVIETFAKSKIEQARREIESGRSLLGVMARRNDEPDVGGLKRGLLRRSLRHGYEASYFSAKPHVLVGPLKAEIYYLFEVTRVTPSRQRTLGEVRDTIGRTLIAGTQHRVFTSMVRALEKKWRSKTRCRAAYVVAQCGGRLA